MEYQVVKTARGNGNSLTCTCEMIVGYVNRGYGTDYSATSTSNINDAYKKQSDYNRVRKCGYEVEAKEK